MPGDDIRELRDNEEWIGDAVWRISPCEGYSCEAEGCPHPAAIEASLVDDPVWAWKCLCTEHYEAWKKETP